MIGRLFPGSIKGRLLLMLLTTITLVWAVAARQAYWDTRQQIHDLFDANLTQAARVVLAQVVDNLEEGGIDYVKREFDEILRTDQSVGYDSERAFQVYDAAGRLVLRSNNAPEHHFAPLGGGFDNIALAGSKWRVATQVDAATGYGVQVAESLVDRDALKGRIARQTLYPVVMALPVIAALIWVAVGRGLKPLTRLARETAQRDQDNLEPVSLRRVPRELRPLLLAQNRLFARMRQALQREREFTANAAHELRTPLAGLKTQAQVAQRAEGAERDRALAKLTEGIDRSSRLIDQLLALARTGESAPRQETVNVAALAQDVVTELAGFAKGRGVDVRLDVPPELSVRGGLPELSILLRNLLDNAIRYAGQGQAVHLRVTRSGLGVCLEVADSGPGIPAEVRHRVTERFYRVPRDTGGSGLGLAIVNQIAEHHGGQLSFHTRENEFVAQVLLPTPAS